MSCICLTNGSLRHPTGLNLWVGPSVQSERKCQRQVSNLARFVMGSGSTVLSNLVQQNRRSFTTTGLGRRKVYTTPDFLTIHADSSVTTSMSPPRSPPASCTPRHAYRGSHKVAAGHDLLEPYDSHGLSLSFLFGVSTLRMLLVRDGTVSPGLWDAQSESGIQYVPTAQFCISVCQRYSPKWI